VPGKLTRSTGGIGPADQLSVVAGSKDKETFIAKEQWINLPVGYNLIDHLNTDLIVDHPDVVFYDFYEAWTSPIVSDRDAYLRNRTGILTQAAPNIGPMVRNCIYLNCTSSLFTNYASLCRSGRSSLLRMASPVSSSGLLAWKAMTTCSRQSVSFQRTRLL